MMSNLYAVAKALHLIGMVSWMAGLFYLVRIMVYHALAEKGPEEEKKVLSPQFGLMEWKVYRIILQPAVVITWTFGTVMLFVQPAWLEQGWMQVKLFFLGLLTYYTHSLKGHIRAFEAGRQVPSDLYYRALNEAPTILMTAIIFLAVFKDRIHFGILAAGLAGFTTLIGWGLWKANKR